MEDFDKNKKTNKNTVFVAVCIFIMVFSTGLAVRFYINVLNSEKDKTASIFLNNFEENMLNLSLAKRVKKIEESSDSLQRNFIELINTTRNISANEIGSDKALTFKIFELEARLVEIAHDVSKLKEFSVSPKVEALEKAIGGDVERVFSVPKLRVDMDEHKRQYEINIIKLEERIRTVSDRMDSFYTLIVGVAVSLICALLGFLGVNLFEKRVKNRF
ncbi:hypothetical protein [Alcaligenes endophyticus]|uniref:Chemotaxis methyl-accepting receptor HlyB-like 4HB MCP domain-containing protein n=1 Tax=Alcaligenes endophyticus TaxID=1929088 RepID=A0ABT8ENG2_9BURK|nr:hypothetical protein [Alcaligenes endophyticus]MCX5592847.1 hypothetical protein [Alcaligenes endophyticus]MDN4122862.1 hypothetical protein [Alcaligenes endophyticus]